MSNLLLSTHRNSMRVSSWACHAEVPTLTGDSCSAEFLCEQCQSLVPQTHQASPQMSLFSRHQHQTPLPLAEQIFSKHPQLFLHVVIFRSISVHISPLHPWVTVYAQVMHCILFPLDTRFAIKVTPTHLYTGFAPWTRNTSCEFAVFANPYDRSAA